MLTLYFGSRLLEPHFGLLRPMLGREEAVEDKIRVPEENA